MPINIRTKGAGAEREIADDLNLIIYMVRKSMGLPFDPTPQVQRNQMQTAVGGKDLIGTYHLAIEVKRQETLNINAWWAQTVASAEKLGEVPVLLYRQNKQKWRCIMPMWLDLPVSNAANYHQMIVRAETDYDAFKSFFQEVAGRAIYKGIQDGSIIVPRIEE